MELFTPLVNVLWFLCSNVNTFYTNKVGLYCLLLYSSCVSMLYGKVLRLIHSEHVLVMMLYAVLHIQVIIYWLTKYPLTPLLSLVDWKSLTILEEAAWVAFCWFFDTTPLYMIIMYRHCNSEHDNGIFLYWILQLNSDNNPLTLLGLIHTLLPFIISDYSLYLRTLIPRKYFNVMLYPMNC